MKRILATFLAIFFLTFLFQGQALAAPGNLTNPGFESGNLSGWTKGTVVDFAGVIGADTYASPYSGNYMVRLGTPRYEGQPIGNNLIYQDFVVTKPQLSFTYNLFTYDYSGYDHFHYRLIDLSTNSNIVNYAQTGWGTSTSLKSTGWKVVTIDLSPYIGKTVRLEMTCGGTSDTAYATWAYFDAQDDTPPVTTATRSPLPNAYGWYNTNVTIGLSAVDNTNGTGVKEIHYRIDGGAFTVTTSATTFFSLSAEGTHNIAYYSVDNTGNIEATKLLQVNIDKTPPTITGSRNPEAGPSGWNNSDVTIHFTGNDSLSGLLSTTPDVTVSTEGAGQFVSGTATDRAGNTASTTVNDINIDKSAPVITFDAITPEPNAAGWNKEDVTIGYSVTDILSGVASGTPESPISFTTEGMGMTQAVTVTDIAGNSATFTSPAVAIDKTPPTLSFGTASPEPNAAGWYNTDVSVPFTAADALSGIAGTNPVSPVILSAEGTAVSETVTVTDIAGNSATFSTPEFKIDKTAPVIAASQSPAPNAEGWNNTDVTVHFTATDAYSDVASVSPDITITAEGTGQSVNGSATDQAGNIATLTVNDINIDKTPPTLSFGTASPELNAAGWYNTDVSIPFTATDALSGIAGTNPVSPIILSAEGTAVSETVTVTDIAGNSATFSTPEFKIDKTAPVIAASQSPAPNAEGWNNTDVTVHFTATDAYSDIASVSPDITITTEGTGQSVTGSATDQAGNIATLTVNNINIDKTPPTITGSRTTEAGPSGWNNSDVTVQFTGSDSLSGLLSTTPDVTVSTEGAGQSATGTATDRAGNTATLTVNDINIDKSAPVITINSPVNMDYSTSGSLTLDFSATDALSGLDNVSGTLDGNPVTSGQTIDLANMAGSHTLTVTAGDVTGNEDSSSVTFQTIVATTIDIDPNTLNLKSQSDDNAFTVFIELPAGYDVNLIDITTIRMAMNDTSLAAQLNPASIGDYDTDRIPDLMVKFNREDVINALNGQTGDITFTVTGNLTDDYSFAGTDMLKVIDPGTSAKKGKK
jgi:hypothetical protein